MELCVVTLSFQKSYIQVESVEGQREFFYFKYLATTNCGLVNPIVLAQELFYQFSPLNVSIFTYQDGNM